MTITELKETIEKIEGQFKDADELGCKGSFKYAEEKIDDTKKNIADLPGRMSEVEKSIEEIQQKIKEVKQNLTA